MLQAITAIGLLVLGFITADWIQLNGGAWLVGLAYLVFFTPLFIAEIIKLRK